MTQFQIGPVSWRVQARNLAGSFLDFLFPPICVSCKKAGVLLCDSCLAKLEWLHEPLCPACGRMMDRVAERCYDCVRRPFSLQQVRTAVFFVDPVQTIIHQFKYENAFALAVPLADIMIQTWPQWAHPIQCLMPIPLHPHRYKTRGYNQSELLARHISQRLNIPLDTHSLQRSRYTRPQVSLNATDRHANVADAFTVTTHDLVGQHILIIDDVFTTGATISAATDALLSAGAATVSGYCLARAKQR